MGLALMKILAPCTCCFIRKLMLQSAIHYSTATVRHYNYTKSVQFVIDLYALFAYMPCHHSPLSPWFYAKDGMNALRLAICGNHPDVVKMLVDEFNVPLMTKSAVSIRSLSLASTDTVTHAWLCIPLFCKFCMYLPHIHIHTLPALKLGKTLFHIAAEENSRECLKLLVYHFKVDPDEPDFVSCNIHTMQ